MVLALLSSLLVMGGLQRAVGGAWREIGRPLVADYVDHLVAELGSPPDRARAQALADRLPLVVVIEGPDGRWQTRRGAADGQPDRPGEPALPPPAVREGLSRLTADGHRILITLDAEALHRQPRRWGLTIVGLLLTLVAITWAIVRRLIRPLRDIGAGAERYGRGDFTQPIPVRRPDELGELAGRVNTMARDLADMLDAKRALLLALSHELRSPLTRARLNAELVAEGPERDALLRDLGEMRNLITDLLESERLAQPHAALQREATDLTGLLHSLVAGGGHGPARPARLDLPTDLPAGWVDRQRLALLLRNLLDNCARHAAGAPQLPAVLVRLQPATGDGAPRLVLSLRDHGPGVEPAQLARLAQPFHRTDAARQRSTGGVGLGLYLARLVAQAHGGRLEVENAHPGLCVRLTLPWPAPPAA
ncbi:HAMP domain-containing protein [Ideonella sp. TBM-1]|uniref:histidine kinase n=2 Tax=Ideonella livida TaxID=2707176 RepID=A0A7C9PHV6_9BURK|nr:HAMP domain-containing protein [Ideonella livida]